MSAVMKLFMFILTAGVMPVLTGLLPVSFLPKEKRRLPWIILSGYLASCAMFEVLGIPVLLFTTYGDYALLCLLFTAADLAVIALGLLRCVRSGGIRLPYALELQAEIYHRRMRDREDGKRFAESAGVVPSQSMADISISGRSAGISNEERISLSPGQTTGRGEPSGVTGRKSAGKRAGGTSGRTRAGARPDKSRDEDRIYHDPDTVFFWIIFALLLLFELYMAYTNASIDGDDSYYVAQSVQTWQTGTMYYYIPYTGWTTQLDGRHALSMMPIWVAYIATLSNTHPTIVAHTMLPMVLIPLADLCLYCAASELLSGFEEERQRRMLPAIMILIAVMQIFGNISIYTPETFLILRTWQGKSLFANLILPAALVLLLYWCRENAGRQQVKFRTRKKPETKEPIPSAELPGEPGKRRENIFFWTVVVSLNLASGFTTALAPAILTVLLLGAAFLIAVFMKKGRFLLSMVFACIPNYLYLILLMRTINSQWFSFLKGGRLP